MSITNELTTSIRYINSAGGGFNARKTVTAGITIEQFFAQQMPGEDPGRYNVRVNNAIPVAGQVLAENDLVSVIPGKYDGGAFGAEFLANLKAAADLGAIVRATPDLAVQLKAVNDLGTMLKDVPDLAGNVGTVIEFVKALQALDQPSTGVPAVTPKPADPAADAEMAKAAHAFRFEPSPREVDTTPLAPGCIRYAGGHGVGTTVAIEDGETIAHFFGRMRPGAKPEAFRIEVNGSTADHDRVLVEGDSVLIRDINAVRGKLAGGSSCT